MAVCGEIYEVDAALRGTRGVDPPLQRRVHMSSTRHFALACTVLALGACESGSSKRTGDMGSVRMALDVASGITLSTVSYSHHRSVHVDAKSGFI